MSKFLPIGTKGELLNSDMIARIIPKEDGGCIILTKDGQHFHSEIDLHDEVNDYNSIRSIIPCQGVSAVYLDDDGDSEICPCAFVMLMSDGKIEPFVFATDKDIERIANKGHTGYRIRSNQVNNEGRCSGRGLLFQNKWRNVKHG